MVNIAFDLIFFFEEVQIIRKIAIYCPLRVTLNGSNFCIYKQIYRLPLAYGPKVMITHYES